MKIGNVLSLFNGMSCCNIALDRAGIEFDKMYSAEIDKWANIVTQANYPSTIQLGDVTNWQDWDVNWSSIDLVTGGFPCQAWSMAGKQLGDKDERGMLFWTMLDIMKEVLKHNPSAKFLIENVKMKKEFEQYITHHTEQALGEVHKILINSALVSAQNRNRYYWTNFEVSQPEDRDVKIDDILQEQGRLGSVVGRKINPETGKRDDYNSELKAEQRFEICGHSKSNTLTTVTKDNMVVDESFFVSQRQLDRLDLSGVENGGARVCFKSPGQNIEKSECLQARDHKGISGRQYYTVAMVEGKLRKLTPIEYERLQTVPDNYTNHVSNTQRYKMLGNGWTVDIIACIFRQIPWI